MYNGDVVMGFFVVPWQQQSTWQGHIKGTSTMFPVFITKYKERSKLEKNREGDGETGTSEREWIVKVDARHHLASLNPVRKARV